MSRFTIRDLLWLMVVVGMSVGWWVDHRRQSAENVAAKRLLDVYEYERKVGVQLNYDGGY